MAFGSLGHPAIFWGGGGAAPCSGKASILKVHIIQRSRGGNWQPQQIPRGSLVMPRGSLGGPRGQGDAKGASFSKGCRDFDSSFKTSKTTKKQ